MNVSVCMIVRNEEKLLQRALQSTAGLADDLVIIDTGSEDRTVEIARSFGAHVYTGGDRRHKAQERNRSIEESCGDWVVILDADETIADPVKLREYLETSAAQGVYINLEFVDAQDKPTLSYQQMRVWRRDFFRYKYRAHEVPLPVMLPGLAAHKPGGWGRKEYQMAVWPKCDYTTFTWQHRPPPDRSWKLEHVLMLLLMDVDENPNDARPMYYLGRQYMYMGAYQQAINTTQKYLDMARGDIDIADAWGNMATCHRALGNIETASQCLYRAIGEQPRNRNWWCELATLYHEQKHHALAANLLKVALEMPIVGGGYVRHQWQGAGLYDLLARCLWYAGRFDEGEEYARKAVEIAPHDLRIMKNLEWFTRRARERSGV